MHATETRDVEPHVSFESLSRTARRRLLLRSLIRAVLITTALLALYYALPLEDDSVAMLAVKLVVAMVIIGIVCVLNVWKVVTAEYPRLRAMDAAAAIVPLLIVLFAGTYLQIASGAPQAFSEKMSRTDGLYFTVTVLSTVGFGDITPVSTTARVVTMMQMMGNLILFGLFARFLAGAMTEGLRRQSAGRPGPDDRPPADADR